MDEKDRREVDLLGFGLWALIFDLAYVLPLFFCGTTAPYGNASEATECHTKCSLVILTIASLSVASGRFIDAVL